MVRNNFMMHLCTFATLCFFKITFPRNYYYCNQDDTIPWVCVLKYVSNSNCCHRHLKLYISMFKSFHTYRKYIYQQSDSAVASATVWFDLATKCQPPPVLIGAPVLLGRMRLNHVMSAFLETSVENLQKGVLGVTCSTSI